MISRSSRINNIAARDYRDSRMRGH
jgi:hypothetical protein